MKNAERYLTQGKIQAAINEYQQVVENEPKDINSRNMLGDLYVKAEDKQAAVNCYQEVAGHYNSQGFAKKAIAIYNKIYRLEPDSLEISTKLAELYQARGSMAEAKKHYEELAKRYELKGHKTEALEIWEKIAEISPRDTEIYIKIADVYWQENRKEEAANAFREVGTRFADKEQHEAAVTAFSRSLEVNPDDLQAIRGIVKSQLALNCPEDAASIIEKALENEPHHKELNYLLMDCYFDMGNPEKAEGLIVSLVEREPASYLKFLDLVNIYLEQDNLDSAVRILSMTSEHLLVGGESELLLDVLNEVLARNPEHIAALRILARFHGWNRDEDELRQTLERLVESAFLNNQVEDEKYALSQYLLLVPHNVDAASRLREINENLGVGGSQADENLLSSQSSEVPTYETFAILSDSKESNPETGFETKEEDEVLEAAEISEDSVEDIAHQVESSEVEIVEETYDEAVSDGPVANSDDESVHTTNSDDESIHITNSDARHHTEDSIHKTDVESAPVEDSIEEASSMHDDMADRGNVAELTPSDEVRLDEEIDSIKFYIEQGYTGLADKSLAELENEFGNRTEIVELRNMLSGSDVDSNSNESAEAAPELIEQDITSEIESSAGEDINSSEQESSEQESSDQESSEQEVDTEASEELVETESAEESEESVNESIEKDNIVESVDESLPIQATISDYSSESFESETVDELIEEERVYTNSFESLKDELGLDKEDKEDQESVQNEFEEHYQHAVVYQEMGMLEEAIREFQDAVKFVKADDGTSRHLNCCTLIGHCFIQKGMPHLSIPWFEKGSEKANLKSQEKLGLYYEIANAYEASGDKEKAHEEFERIYSLDVDYRDVGERLETLNKEILTPA